MRRDFSESAKQELLSLVAQVESEKWSDFTDWWGDRWYDFEAWIGALDIKDYIDNVNEYHKKVIDKNNTTAGEITQIFEEVNNVSSSYQARFTALLADLRGFKTSVTQLADTVLPENGLFYPEYIGAGLKEALNSYLAANENLLIVSGDGLTEEEAEALGEDERKALLDLYTSAIIDTVPGIKLDEGFEIPIGPGVTFYYKVSGETDGNITVNIENIINEQKIELKGLNYEGEIGGYKLGGEIGNESSIGFTTPFGNGVQTWENGLLTNSYEKTIGKNTYSYKFGMSTLLNTEIVIEKSVKTDLEGGSITSTAGMKYEDNKDKWKPLAVPVPVESPYTCQIPQFDIDWETVQVAGTCLLVAAGIIALGTATGGLGFGAAGGAASYLSPALLAL